MSDNKLIENKEVLNEGIITGFIMIGLTALTMWAFKKIRDVKVIGKDGVSGLSAEVYNAIPNLYTDKEFVKDFVKILQKESNLEDIINKSQTEWYAYKNLSLIHI